METIGFCEDDAAQLALLRHYLDACSGEDAFRVIEATDSAAFWEALRPVRPDLVFLDIDIGGENGIQLGRQLRELYPETVIVYITAHEQFALEAFRVRAFHYLLKPVTTESFRQTLREALAYIRTRGRAPEKHFSIQLRGELISLPYSRILFFEKVGHRIRVHTEDRDIFYYGNMQDLWALLDGDSFLQCHQGFVVNVQKIRSFRERTLFLDGNAQAPVSRTYADSVRDKLTRKLFEGRDTP